MRCRLLYIVSMACICPVLREFYDTCNKLAEEILTFVCVYAR